MFFLFLFDNKLYQQMNTIDGKEQEIGRKQENNKEKRLTNNTGHMGLFPLI